jgi:3',5'-cyclic-AMP phosphodiesterase
MQRSEKVARSIQADDGFREARKQILALPVRPSGLLIAGDCTNLGRPVDYAALHELLRPLEKARITVRLAVGNHDIRENLKAAFPKQKFLPITSDDGKPVAKLASIWETPKANFFFLDSAIKRGTSAGEIGRPQLAWLAKELDARPDKPAIIVAHHHPDPLGKLSGFSDAMAFFNVVLPRKQVKAYIFGHTHRWGVTEISGVHFINLPTTAWVVDSTWPRGFATLRLRPDGATLTLHTLDRKDARDGQKSELAWRK